LKHFFYITSSVLVLFLIGITNYALADNAIQFGVPFQLGFNQTATMQELQIKIVNLTDSRCPSDVTCVWQGQAKILIDINKDSQNLGNFSLSLNDKSLAARSFDHYSIQLIKVDPYPISTKKIQLSDYDVTLKLSLLPPLKQLKSGISTGQFSCLQGLTLVIKSEDNSPACVKPQTAQKLVERGWAKSQENSGILVTLSEGQREGPLLVQKIFQDSIQGLDFREYPLATNVGSPITLHIGDSASNGCTVELTLVKISGSMATFLKKENQNRPCPICLSGNTVIDTPEGNINVKELRIGMQVWTLDNLGHKQVGTILKIGKTLVPPTHKMVHLILNDGRELFASPGHPTADGRLLGDLSKKDLLDNSQVNSIERVPYGEKYTYDILPSGPTGFYWANDILVGSTLK